MQEAHERVKVRVWKAWLGALCCWLGSCEYLGAHAIIADNFTAHNSVAWHDWDVSAGCGGGGPLLHIKPEAHTNSRAQQGPQQGLRHWPPQVHQDKAGAASMNRATGCGPNCGLAISLMADAERLLHLAAQNPFARQQCKRKRKTWAWLIIIIIIIVVVVISERRTRSLSAIGHTHVRLQPGVGANARACSFVSLQMHLHMKSTL